MRLIAAAAIAAIVITGAAEAKTWRIRPGAEAEQQLQTALIEARPGDTVRLARGRFELSGGLSLDVDRVTIRGDGHERSILSFNNQRRGAEGLLVTSDGVTLRDFAVENARGDAIKARDCNGIHIRGVRVEWTRGPNADNGAYGLYPVNCDNVLIERSIARGASDAGIYVGQSRNIIVRENLAEFNVAGIEIENSLQRRRLRQRRHPQHRRHPGVRPARPAAAGRPLDPRVRQRDPRQQHAELRAGRQYRRRRADRHRRADHGQLATCTCSTTRLATTARSMC